jgi:hypothetical protein
MEGGVMVRGNRVVTFELDTSRERSSLHEFIRREINPLLEAGWMVRDVRISTPCSSKAQRCRMEVVLAEACADAAHLEATL